MKSDEFSAVRPEEIIKALDQSLAAADKAEALLADADDVFRQDEILREGLADWDEALTLYTAADQSEWSDADKQAVEDELGRTTAIVHALVSAQEQLPPILADRKVAFDDEDILLQQAPDAEADEAEHSCCFTRLRFRNRTEWRVEIRVSGEDGQQESHVFRPGERESVRKIDGKGRTIPGGMGRCVTIEARARYREGWGEYHSMRLCCDDDPLPAIGEELWLSRPVNENHRTRFRGIQLLAREALSPCPETQTGGGTGRTGTAHSGITGIPGLEVGRRRYHYGAHAVMRFVPTKCRRFCFVQGKKRMTKAKYPGAADFRVMPGMSTPGTSSPGDRWMLDTRDQDRTPCYPHTRPLPGGGMEMRDYPGVENPFGRFRLDGDLVRLPRGTELEVTWTFRTWVVCLAPRVHLLGQFDWNMVLKLTIGRNHRDTTGKVEMTPPNWSETTDLDEYRGVAGQARETAGFIPR